MQILFGGELLPDHMTMKQLWLSRWFGKVGGVGRWAPAAPGPPALGGEMGTEQGGGALGAVWAGAVLG